MHAIHMRRLLQVTALSKKELNFGLTNSTRMFLSLWFDLDKAGRELMIRFLHKAHEQFGKKMILAVSVGEVDAINNHVNQVLTREAVLVANDPTFAPHASRLKGIIVSAMGIRINMPLKDVPKSELINRYSKAVREALKF